MGERHAATTQGFDKERKKTHNPREGWEDGTPPPHRDFKERGVSYIKKERKKTDTPNEGWDEDRVPTCTAGFRKDDQGDRWGSPAPDKGHDRLAARCAVDSHIHWRSHLSLATCLQLVAGSLSYHRHTDTGVAGAAARVSHILCGPH